MEHLGPLFYLVEMKTHQIWKHHVDQLKKVVDSRLVFDEFRVAPDWDYMEPTPSSGDLPLVLPRESITQSDSTARLSANVADPTLSDNLVNPLQLHLNSTPVWPPIHHRCFLLLRLIVRQYPQRIRQRPNRYYHYCCCTVECNCTISFQLVGRGLVTVSLFIYWYFLLTSEHVCPMDIYILCIYTILLLNGWDCFDRVLNLSIKQHDKWQTRHKHISLFYESVLADIGDPMACFTYALLLRLIPLYLWASSALILSQKTSSVIKNSAHFIEVINRQSTLPDELILVDVVSLFTNIPTNLAMSTANMKLE